jgi:2-polyprenyl-3-methyl-5-hydroxy-6-metoxy-1,4-benzoquinol methylase
MAHPSTSYNEFRWAHAGAGNGASGEGLARTFISMVKDLKGVDTICDLGCGNGYLTGRLAELGYTVVGIDASVSGLKVARQNYPAAKFVHSIINGKLESRAELERFDLVVSSDVIEHLYRPSELVKDALSLLKPNGQFLIGTPYHGYLKNLVLSLSGRMDAHFTALDEAGHIKFFSVQTLSRLLHSHGFSDLKFSFYGRAPWLWKNMICHARKAG